MQTTPQGWRGPAAGVPGVAPAGRAGDQVPSSTEATPAPGTGVCALRPVAGVLAPRDVAGPGVGAPPTSSAPHGSGVANGSGRRLSRTGARSVAKPR